jgi:uncharacterized protein (DUF58 family)
MALAGFSLWRNTGSVAGLFVCCVSVVVLTIDTVWSILATRGVAVEVVANPSDVYVGEDYPLRISISGPRRDLLLRLAFEGAPSVRVQPPVTATPRSTGLRRGVVSALPVEIWSRGLCGLVTHVRRHEVAFFRPMAIGPRPLAPAEPLRELFDSWEDGGRRREDEGDIVHGVRDYLPGDSMRQIHWRATARRDELIVKEVEQPGSPQLLLALDVGSGDDAGEQAARRAAWYVLEALHRGHDVLLSTVEDERQITGPLSSPSDVNRRLAAATPGRPAPPRGHECLRVTPDGDSWG